MRFRLALLAGAFSIATQADSGSDRYTPTKLEWLVTEMSACCKVTGTDPDTPSVSFLEKRPNTLVVSIYVETERKMKQVDLVFETTRKTATSIAESHGWTWLRVEKRIEKLY